MDLPNQSSNSSNYSNNGGKKRNLFEMAFDPWASPAGKNATDQQIEYEMKKTKGFDLGSYPRAFERATFGDTETPGSPGHSIAEDSKFPVSSKGDELYSTLNKHDSDMEIEADSSHSLPVHMIVSSNLEKKAVDEPDDDAEDGSSATTTASQSSYEPGQTPRSSNDGNGNKSDKGEPEHTKSVHPASTNGVNYISPSITKRSVTLQMLLVAGILKPGEGTMSLEYHGQKFMGDLLENGQIRSQETSQIFSSPSAWATTCKQIINPDKSLRKSGCGWASIKYKSLKLDYYKAVWFKRLREGSIDIRNISNGAVISSSSDTDDDETPHFILKFGEHLENNPRHQSAQQIGAKILISCTEFKDLEKLQPFHVKVSTEALALADFHCNITSTEALGYLSGRWNGDQNVLKIEKAHPCQLFMPASTTTECDNERNRAALEVQKLGTEVVGWYHSHPKAPPLPSKDDIARQLEYQVLMKGATEASYIPCVGIIFSPVCYSEPNENRRVSNVQFFWSMPPPENRPLEMSRPMHLDYETSPSTEFDPQKLLGNMSGLVEFYKSHKELLDVNELSGKLECLKDTVSSWLPALNVGDFWLTIENKMKSAEVSLKKVDSPLASENAKSSSTSNTSSPATQLLGDDTEEAEEAECETKVQEYIEDK